MTRSTPALRLVHDAESAPIEWAWFCGHCAAPSPEGRPPAPNARVCRSCKLGLLLEVRADALPGPRDAFLVVDSALLVQAVSRRGEQLLAVTEETVVNHPVADLLVGADAEARGPTSFAGSLAGAAAGSEEPLQAFVRPWNTFGVRMRARIAPCGPPRAALVVLEDERRGLRPIASP